MARSEYLRRADARSSRDRISARTERPRRPARAARVDGADRPHLETDFPGAWRTSGAADLGEVNWRAIPYSGDDSGARPILRHPQLTMDIFTGNLGWIEVICGPMFSGKSEELIRRLRRANFARKRVQVFKPVIDTRYSETEIVS